ncbi:toxin-antitoxin system, toxin component, Fic family [Psychroflexus torquis ATCC 700755]|uniref:Toxin-antitoxin system, toxin component, Fic family n=1 Tax=Psychroflexus torquis (strain ATCC 700755 / CIP 106069 / ACAM 623) TaxID=313595 RepID=K4IVS1_PSYTT|nr:Fic family protein [Psychroflexus torquis]AFU69550.1 toxin-antitoxin system, toxin component, Fic family [Psychroflexus torquis ATCC 700755]
MEVISLLSKADRQLGRLDMYSEYVNIDLFIRMHIAKEATQSSKIEGTQTNMEDAFLSREEVSLDKRDDWEEVQNYIQAMNEAVKLLYTSPFSSRLIKQTHKILLQGVRGANKLPGEFRISQNWIGGASINDAMFIPPVHTSIGEIMSDLEHFANNELNHLPDLLKIAIIHYQFETIHPFLDGNGRVGRLLITLYLVNKGILKQPILYLSDFFERNRLLYYDNLMRVRSNNDINQWLKFFLTGIIETAKKGVTTFDGIMQLQKTLELKIKGLGNRSGDAKKVIDYLYTQPVIEVSRVGKIIQKSNVTAYKLLNTLEEIEVLKEVSGAQRNKLYVFNEYINLFKID